MNVGPKNHMMVNGGDSLEEALELRGRLHILTMYKSPIRVNSGGRKHNLPQISRDIIKYRLFLNPSG